MKATRPNIIAAGRPNAVDATCVWPQCHGTQYVSFPLCAKHGYDVYSRVAEAKARPEAKVEIADPAGLLQWLGKDRAMVTFADLSEAKAKAKALKALVKGWVGFV